MQHMSRWMKIEAIAGHKFWRAPTVAVIPADYHFISKNRTKGGHKGKPLYHPS